MNSMYQPIYAKGNVFSTVTQPAQSPGVFRPKPTKRRTGGLTLHILGHIIGLLWLAPIIALLVLNFNNHVIGASVWCPSGRCDSGAFDIEGKAIERAEKLDRRDHDVLGGLQYVAKALEVWFMFVATGLVYDIALLFAKRWGGLPIGYLFTHLEFGDIRNLVNPTLWTSPLPHDTQNKRGRSTLKLYLFAAFVAFLTLLTNFMGPAAAALVLPTLQWVDTDKIPVQQYIVTDAGSPPRGNTVLPGCTDAELQDRNYTCTSRTYGPSLDSFLASAASSIQQGQLPWGYSDIKAASNEGLLTFQANLSASDGQELVWIPLRQTLRDLSLDFINLQSTVYGDGMQVNETSNSQPRKEMIRYNTSLETVLQRQGPAIGVQIACHIGNYTEVDIDNDRTVMCYDNWSDGHSNYTKCIREGSGWSTTNKEAQFNLGDGEDFESETTVYVYTSDKATYFNSTTDFGSGIKDCIEQNRTSCPWDTIFDTELPEVFRNSSRNVQIQEYWTPESSTRVWCDSVSYLAFPIYSVDTLSTANPLSLVQLHNLPNASSYTPLVVHPDWWLAAWSVPYNGTIDRNRTVGRTYGQKLRAFFNEDFERDQNNADQQEALYDHVYSIAQSVSLISYQFDNSSTATAAKSSDDNPIFYRYATLRVWAYGLSARTSKLGVAVALVGCACVLARVILAAALKIRHEHSTVELFVAALEHNHHGEFDNIEDEAVLGRVRYFVDEEVHRQRPTFVSEKVRSSSGLSASAMYYPVQRPGELGMTGMGYPGGQRPGDLGITRSY